MPHSCCANCIIRKFWVCVAIKVLTRLCLIFIQLRAVLGMQLYCGSTAIVGSQRSQWIHGSQSQYFGMLNLNRSALQYPPSPPEIVPPPPYHWPPPRDLWIWPGPFARRWRLFIEWYRLVYSWEMPILRHFPNPYSCLNISIFGAIWQRGYVMCFSCFIHTYMKYKCVFWLYFIALSFLELCWSFQNCPPSSFYCLSLWLLKYRMWFTTLCFFFFFFVF